MQSFTAGHSVNVFAQSTHEVQREVMCSACEAGGLYCANMKFDNMKFRCVVSLSLGTDHVTKTCILTPDETG